jgi:hypothetical protein
VTNLEIKHVLRVMQAEIDALKAEKPVFVAPEPCKCAERVTKLENNYRMLTARLSRKNKDGDSSLSG